MVNKMRIRILPLVIIASFTLVVVKASDFFINKEDNILKAFAQEKDANAPGNLPIPEGEEPARLSPNYSGGGPQELDISNLSDTQKNLLESLAKRREELEKWSQSIAMKENILNATEKKINNKMDELAKLKAEVKELLEEYTEKESKKIQRLVKIYENMKAQDAAEIFAKMEQGVVLEVIGKMKESKAAKVLGLMPPSMADSITVELAKQRRLTEQER